MNRAFKKSRSEDGFTLLELLVVIVLIGILAAIAVPVFINAQNAAHDASVKSDARNTVIGVAAGLMTKPDATGFSVLAAGDTVAAVKLIGVPSIAVNVPIGAVAVRAVVTQSNWVTVRGTGADYVVHAQSTIDGFWYEFSSKTGRYTSSTDNPVSTPGVPSSKDPVTNSVKNPDGIPVRVPGDPVTTTTDPGTGTGGTGGTGGGSSGAAITLIQAYDRDKGESGLYTSDGTSLKLLQRAVVNNDDNFSHSHPTYKGKTYLMMYTTDYPRTLKLWSTDGNTMTPVDNIVPAPNTGLIVYNNLLYFTANSGDGAGNELSSWDGTTLTRVEDINPGAGDSVAPDMTIYNNHLIFSGYDGTSNGLYSYDGTTTSTISTTYAPVRATDTLATKRLFPFNGKLIYTNNVDSQDQQLFEYDGTTSRQVTNLGPTSFYGGTFSNYTVMGGVLYFRAGEVQANGSYDWFLYWFDGTTVTKATTSDSVNSYLGGVQPGMAAVNGTLYFISNANLWSYSPANGVVKVAVATLDNGPSSSGAVFIGVLNGTLRLALADSNGDSQVYSYDGTTLTKTTNVPFGMSSTYPPPAVSGSYVYFQAYDSNYNEWLYSTDGTTDTKLSMINDSLVLGLVG